MRPAWLHSLRQGLHLKALLAPEHLTERGRWLEVIGIPLLVVGMAWWWNPEDPLLLKAAFPWLWFAPALVALRYGVLAGLLAGMVLLINWLLANAWNVAAITATEFPRDYFFGGGLLVLLAGEFSDVWRDRIARMDETNLYVTERLSRLTKRHLLLNISHDRMEQEMLARPGSLRDALASLRNVVMTADKTHSPLPGLPELLNLLAQYINIEAASVYQVEEKNGRILLGTALQTMGAPHPLEPHDELFELMVETRSMAHVAGSDVSLERQSQQLIVAPLIASNSQILGVLAVTKLPFYSLNVESLQMMAVTLGYYADHILNNDDVARLRQHLPTIPATYAEELARMVRMQRKVGITSHIVVMTFAGSFKDEIPTQFLRIKRGLDLYWQSFVNGNPVIALLMPFASASAKDGFFQRVEGWLQSTFGGSSDSLHIHFRVIDIAVEDPIPALVKVMQA
jgi:hypothetical protein